MRFPLTLLMLSASVACPLLLSPAAARAEVIYYTEDFKNGDTPGFDPMFNHELLPNPWGGLSWQIMESPELFWLTLASGTTDRITFNLPSSAVVAYASVVSVSPLDSFNSTSVRFVGTRGSWETGPDDYGKTLVEIASSEIGALERIDLYSSQGGFTKVVIGVIPEPSGFLLGCSAEFVGEIGDQLAIQACVFKAWQGK